MDIVKQIADKVRDELIQDELEVVHVDFQLSIEEDTELGDISTLGKRVMDYLNVTENEYKISVAKSSNKLLVEVYDL